MTENPGGTSFHSESGPLDFLSSCVTYFREAYKRPSNEMFVIEGMDSQRRPPSWMERRTVAIDGSELTPEEKGASWWETKYARELMIGDAIAKKHHRDIAFQLHDLFWYAEKAFQWAGFSKEHTREDWIQRGIAVHEKNVQEKEKEREEQERRRNKKADWRSLMNFIEGDTPIITVVKQKFRTHDAYGIDEFLDHPLSLIWLCTKLGVGTGLVIGFGRAFKAIRVDAMFMHASGIGTLTLYNAIVVTTVMKWAGNFGICAAAFQAGDYVVRRVKAATFTSRYFVSSDATKLRGRSGFLLRHCRDPSVVVVERARHGTASGTQRLDFRVCCRGMPLAWQWTALSQRTSVAYHSLQPNTVRTLPCCDGNVAL